jgi:hypothetical protein
MADGGERPLKHDQRLLSDRWPVDDNPPPVGDWPEARPNR